MSPKGFMIALILAISFAAPVSAASEVDSHLPDYQRVSGISGSLSSVGSDTLANVMVLWGEAFKRLYPAVVVQVQAAGSSTAPPALIEGTASIGPMSRRMRDIELQAFEQVHGYKPTAVPVAIDALAVFVHKDNPIKGLTLQQLDAIFSTTRLCGAKQAVRVWGDLGMSGEWTAKPLQLFGRNSVSGTYGYFKEVALCKGDFKPSVNEQPGSASVVQSVSQSLGGIGYSAIGYRTDNVRAIPLARSASSPFIAGSELNTLNGSYPLSRFLYIYVNKVPGKPLAPLEAEFLRMVLSKTGQQLVARSGYIPLPAKTAQKALKTLGLQP